MCDEVTEDFQVLSEVIQRLLKTVMGDQHEVSVILLSTVFCYRCPYGEREGVD